MLQTLSDLFLLISDDGKKITNKDILIFYNFIIKKMPQIEQQYPSIILKSLDNSYENNSTDDKKQKNVNEFKNSKEAKKIFTHFQKQILNLFNELLDYCYNTKIIKLNDKFEKMVKGKIDDKIREKANSKKNLNNNNCKYNYNNVYQKELFIKKAKKEEFRNILIVLLVNGEINFNIYPNDYVNFFNSENKSKIRESAELFMKFIKNVIIIYKENKKNINKKLHNKSNYNTDKKKETKNNNKKDEKNKTDEKYKSEVKNDKKDEIKNNIGLKAFNTDIKIVDTKNKNIKINNRKAIRNKNNKNKFSSDVSKNKFISLSNSENYNPKKSKENIIEKKRTLLSERSIIINNDNSINDDDDEDEINDTIRCETPKNINKEPNIEKEKINLGKIFFNNDQNKRRYSADKNTNIINTNTRITISSLPSKDEDKLNSKPKKKRDISEYNSSKRFSYAKNQKKNLVNRNKNNISPGTKYNKYHQSLIDEKYINNIKEKKNFLDDKMKPINKSQSIIAKDPFNIDTLNIGKIVKNKKYNCESVNNKKIEKEEEKPDTIFNDEYNLVSKVRKDKNNNEFKDIYLYKNLEVHQHLVIFNEDNKKEEKEDDSEDIGCIIF